MTSYPQLDDAARVLLVARVSELKTKAAVAKELGVTRSAVSQALSGTYPADARKLSMKIMERYASAIGCSHLGRDIPPSLCRGLRERPLPTSPVAAVKQWQACRMCEHNPSKVKVQL